MSTHQNTGTSDATREAITAPTQDVTRAGSKDDIGDDVAMEGDSADQSSAGHPSPVGSRQQKEDPDEERATRSQR